MSPDLSDSTEMLLRAVVWHAALRSGAVDQSTGGRGEAATPVLYVDKNPWGRADDDLTIPRNAVEAAAFEGLLAAFTSGDARLAYTSIAYGEASPRDGRPSPGRRALWGVIDLRAGSQQLIFHDVRADTELLAALLYGSWNISGHDALHAAAAILEGAWYFVSGDDRLLKRLNAFFAAWGLPFDAVTPAEALTRLHDGASLRS